MSTVNLKPNSFVGRIAEGLQEKGVDLQQKASELTASAEFQSIISASKPKGRGRSRTKQPDGTARGDTSQSGSADDGSELPVAPELVLGLAAAADVPELISFAGYVGATYTRDSGGEPHDWTVLYLDTRLYAWLLIDGAGLV
jgi:hypothetical protein